MRGTSQTISVCATTFLLILSSCCGSKSGANSTPQPRIISAPTTIAPGRCRIDGTVLAWDTLHAPARGTCRMRVDSILGYGSSFGMPLSPGTIMTVRIASFAGDARSSSSPPEGTRIRGDIERNAVDEEAGGGLNFTMYDGVILKESSE